MKRLSCSAGLLLCKLSWAMQMRMAQYMHCVGWTLSIEHTMQNQEYFGFIACHTAIRNQNVLVIICQHDIYFKASPIGWITVRHEGCDIDKYAPQACIRLLSHQFWPKCGHSFWQHQSKNGNFGVMLTTVLLSIALQGWLTAAVTVREFGVFLCNWSNLEQFCTVLGWQPKISAFFFLYVFKLLCDSSHSFALERKNTLSSMYQCTQYRRLIWNLIKYNKSAEQKYSSSLLVEVFSVTFFFLLEPKYLTQAF